MRPMKPMIIKKRTIKKRTLLLFSLAFLFGGWNQVHAQAGFWQSGWHSTLQFFGLEPNVNKKGVQAYQEENYDEALHRFTEAQVADPESQAIALNKGNAQYKQKKYKDAILSYKQAMIGKDVNIAASAYYNTGNSEFRQGEFALLQQSSNPQNAQGPSGSQGPQPSANQNAIPAALEHYRNAMAHYKKTLEINPDYLSAKQNIEVVQARIKELLEQQQEQQQNQQQNQDQKQPKPSEKAKAAFARAMQLVKQRKYNEAKVVLESILQEDATASSYQPHLKRLEDVLNIIQGKSITKPLPQDPRSQQQGLGVI